MHPLADLLICLRFFSRVPLPATSREIELGAGGLAEASAVAPVAGALIGGASAVMLMASMAMGLPPIVAAPLAMATSLLVTGALHEDGLADCADGFGGGRTRDRKLEIMRDSRIGTFGACAIALSLYLRAVALGVIAARSPWLGAAVLVAAGALSRSACLVPLVFLPPARPDGAGATVRPSTRMLGIGLALSLIVSLGVLGEMASAGRVLAAIFLAAVVTLGVCAIARRQIGGQTGDVAGATQQLVEIAVFLVFAAA